jgi:glycosyltransferase involved in cell wall biosynthesis
VAVVSDAVHPFHVGGKETRYRFLIEQMTAQGASVDVYTMKWWNGGSTYEDGPVKLHALMRNRPMYRNGKRRISQAVMFAASTFALVGAEFDVIEADQMPYLQLLPLRLVASVKRRPLVVTWHEFWGPSYWQGYLGRLGPVAARIERLATHLPDAIIAVSPETERRLREAKTLKPITVISAGVDLASIDAVAPSRPGFDVLFAGRLIAHKQLDLALRAVAQLAGEGRKLSFGIVGEGPAEVSLRLLSRQLGIEGQVSFLGRLETDVKLWGLMKASRVFLLPSVREGFGLVILEAIACGVPVVVVRHPDNFAAELVSEGRTGWIAASTVDGIATALSGAMDDDRATYDAVLARNVAESHRWDESAASALSTYKVAARLRGRV